MRMDILLLGSTVLELILKLIQETPIWLQNGADAVGLYIGDDTDYPNDTPVSDVNLIDALVYDTNDGEIRFIVFINSWRTTNK